MTIRFARTVRALLTGSLVVGGALTAMVVGGQIPASASAVIKTITVGVSPTAVSSDGTHVWVANNGDGTVTELNATTGAVIGAPISVGSGARSGPDAISSDGTHVWVANSNDGTVTELNAATGVVVGTPIPVGPAPNSISSDGTDVWVTQSGGTKVTELSASTGSFVQTITPANLSDGRSPGPSEVSSDGTHVWVGESTAGSVSEIDPSSGQITEPITDLGAAPDAISSDGTHVWVTLSGSGGTVLEFQASNDQLFKSTTLNTDVYAVSSDGTDAWVTEQHAGDITEFNDSTGGVIQNIANPAGTGGPEGISSDGVHVWVADYFSTISTVSEITIAPATSVLVPSPGTPLSESTYLDASASNATSVEFLLVGGDYSLSSPHVAGTAMLTPYGWLDSWNTTTVPNGSYTLFSYAIGSGGSTASSGVSITVNNSLPSTSVLVPSNGATLSKTTAALDASASNATSVEFLLIGGSYSLRSPHVVGTATPTLYGWLDSWNTTTVPNGSYTLFSYATGPGGSTASSGVSITVNN